MNSINYFIGSNSAKGYFSFYNENINNVGNVIKLPGYPTFIMNDVVNKTKAVADNKGYAVEIIHNCLDNSVEGIIIPILDLCIINTISYNDKIKREFSKSHKCFGLALEIHDDWEKIYIANMDFDILNKFTQNIIDMILDKNSLDKKGEIINRFFGAATVNGAIDYIDNITEGIDKRYFLKGRPGTGKSTFLKKIANKAVSCGFDVEIYHCAFDPNSLDLITIRELGICFFDSTSPHEYFPTRENDEILDIYKIAVAEGTDEKYEKELNKIKAKYKEKINGATKHLIKAKKYYDKMQEEFVNLLDLDELQVIKNNIISSING